MASLDRATRVVRPNRWRTPEPGGLPADTRLAPPPEEAPDGLSEQSAELWRLVRRMWLRHKRTSVGSCEACGWMWPCATVQMNDWTLQRLARTAHAAARRRL